MDKVKLYEVIKDTLLVNTKFSQERAEELADLLSDAIVDYADLEADIYDSKEGDSSYQRWADEDEDLPEVEDDEYY
jgi:hypothetical protein